jgi:hypothetical protein
MIWFCEPDYYAEGEERSALSGDRQPKRDTIIRDAQRLFEAP